MLLRFRIALAALIAAALAVAGGGVAAAAQPTPTPVPVPVPVPSLVQLCAATGIATADALIAGVAESDLVGDLAPLVDLTVPRNSGGVALDADVTLAQLRDELDCDALTAPPTPTPTPTPTPGPTEAPDPGSDRVYDSCAQVRAAGADPLLATDPGYRVGLDADRDGIACEAGEDDGFSQTPLVPSGGVATGGRSVQR